MSRARCGGLQALCCLAIALLTNQFPLAAQGAAPHTFSSGGSDNSQFLLDLWVKEGVEGPFYTADGAAEHYLKGVTLPGTAVGLDPGGKEEDWTLNRATGQHTLELPARDKAVTLDMNRFILWIGLMGFVLSNAIAADYDSKSTIPTVTSTADLAKTVPVKKGALESVITVYKTHLRTPTPTPRPSNYEK